MQNLNSIIKLIPRKYKFFITFLLFLFAFLYSFYSQNSFNYPQNLESNQNFQNLEKAKVIRVVDGDTIKVEIQGKNETIRLLGINTPESVDPRKKVECMGIEASQKTKEILEGKNIFLEKDESQGDRDKYNRLLRYVFLENNFSVNAFLIENGFAYEYTYNLPYKYQEQYKSLEKSAREKGLGLWGDVCEKL